jgi:hypothetical protein
MACPRCGDGHDHDWPRCPQVKALEFSAENKISRVEFLTPLDYHRFQLQLPTAATAQGASYPRLGVDEGKTDDAQNARRDDQGRRTGQG